MSTELGMGLVEATKKSDNLEYANDDYMNYDEFFEPVDSSEHLYGEGNFYDFFQYNCIFITITKFEKIKFFKTSKGTFELNFFDL